MGIKNWTVTVESVKSTAARELYLLNLNHKNHSNTSRIINIWGNKQTSLNIQYQCEKRKLTQLLNRKGGRPPLPAMEYVFALPKGIRPTEQQWQSILKIIVANLSRSIGLKPKDFNGIVRAVLHQQQQNDGIRGTGDHLHVLFGKFTNDGKYLRELQKKGAIHITKQAFNLAVKTELGICHTDYIVQNNFSKTAKKRAPQWRVKAARQHEDQEKRLFLIRRNFEKVLKQCEKWLKAFELEDKVQMNRQYNRIIKSLDQLNNQDERNDRLESLINSMTAIIDKKSKKQQLPKLSISH
ncbi:TPA: hypothetical protein ACPVYN_002429 [Vibrio parahaemolyticus]|uniref:hypothetical protein n=1 Tax=Vibrio parahaemolyticus TaxID=670 RepID=UPI000419E796|nr:hypothetical protein [Vibrio parahaemolyticus]